MDRHDLAERPISTSIHSLQNSNSDWRETAENPKNLYIDQADDLSIAIIRHMSIHDTSPFHGYKFHRSTYLSMNRHTVF